MEEIDFRNYSLQLSCLINPKGNRIVHDKEIQELWNLNAELDKLIKLFSYQDSQNYEKFFSQSVVIFIKQGGYNLDELLEVAELKDHDGNDILDSCNEFFNMLKIKGDIEDTIEIAKIKDSEGFTIYRIQRDIWGEFDGFEEITNLLKCGGNAQKVQELTDILNDDGISVFRTPRDIGRFIKSKGTKEYAKSLMEIRDNNNNQIFNEYSIGLFKEHQGTIDYAINLTNIRDTEGRTVFSDGEDVENFHLQEREWNSGKWRYIHRDIKTAKEFVDLKDSEGKTVFRDGRDIINFLKSKGTIDEAKQYIAIKDPKGKTYFRGDEIALLRKNKVPVEYARSLSRKGLNATTIMYYYKIGSSDKETEFNFSGKPKALILYPTSDPIQMVFQAYSEDATFKFFQTIKNAYDMKVRAISSAQEMYSELDNSPEIDLLILGGHGSKTTLRLGENLPKYDIFIDEKSALISTETKGLRKHLRKLSPEAIIYLDSCKNGEGRESEENLANYFAREAEGRKIISSTEPFNIRGVTINHIYPLDLSIVATYGRKDSTYVIE